MAEPDRDQMLIALFDSQGEAEQAAKDLMGWDKAENDVKLGAIGVLTKDDKGEIRTSILSQRNTRKGAKVGMGLGVIAAVFSGGLTLIPTAIGGAVAGGAAGALFRKGLGVSDEELQQLSSELDGGHAALLIFSDASGAQATSEYLFAAGGRVQSHATAVEELLPAEGAPEHPGHLPGDPTTPPPSG
jgi:uncharacterized membrane protein